MTQSPVSSSTLRRRPIIVTAATRVASALARRLTRDALATGLLCISAGLIVTFFVLLSDLSPGQTGRSVGLSQAQQLVRSHQATDATLLDHDDRIVLDRRTGGRVSATYPASGALTSSLTSELTREHVPYAIDAQSAKPTEQILVQFLIPILLLVCLFAFFARLSADRGAGGVAAFSRYAGGRRQRPDAATRVTFDDIAGAGEAVAELREIRDYLADPARYAAFGAAAPKGVLIVGPPGTGKTLLAKAVADEVDATFFSLSGSDFVESLVGVGAARVRDLFRQARQAAPAIIFIDELDAAGRKRGAGIGQGNDEREQTLNQILVEMDGFAGDAGIVVLAATNRPDILDPALLRPGRFDRQVTVDVPDVHGRLEILQLHATGRPLAHDTSLEQIARMTPGFSGAELANVINEAALLTIRANQPLIAQETLEEAIERVIAGPAKAHMLTAEERELIATHEASHAVVSEALGATAAHRKLSLVARGRRLGVSAATLTDRDAAVHSEPALRAQLITMLAGAAGEHLAFGHYSTGVSDDLHEASALARRMITSFGMSDAIGPTAIGDVRGEVFLGASLQDLGNIGPHTLDIIDAEIRRMIGDAEARATYVLRANWGSVRETARALIEQETLSGVALDALLSPITTVSIADLTEIHGEDHTQEPRPT
jgi:cell division protease FtsH